MTKKVMTVKPLGYRVKITRRVPEEVTESGIVVSVGTSRKRDLEAETIGVISDIGPRAWTDEGDEDSRCEVGDKVMFTRYAGLKVDPDDELSDVLVQDRDILGLVVEEEEDYRDR